jgi:hypothetical protein
MGTTRKTHKREKRLYRFTLDMERYGELVHLLDSIPKPLRGEYIAESLKIARAKLSLQNSNTEPPVEFKGTFDL